jgi:hypothetical protein
MMPTIMLLVMLTQTTSPPEDWVRLTAQQTKPSAVIRFSDSQQPTLNQCREATFESNGLDLVSESQFTLIVIAVVDRGGKIQRFRIARKPSFKLDLTTPVRRALATWRYEALKAGQLGDAFERVILLAKPMGARQTSACPPAEPRR